MKAMLDLVKWSFTLPMIAIVLALGAQLASSSLQFILKKTGDWLLETRQPEGFTRHSGAEIARLRARTHAH
jgi:hypothetical protein